MIHSIFLRVLMRYTDGQEDQLGALGLVTNAVVLWKALLQRSAN
ncbi:hypothetical protein [Candidatus Williamhamiltonella defendens]|nr:hypothetical protein [Candidatus Hamiltonella defensa]